MTMISYYYDYIISTHPGILYVSPLVVVPTPILPLASTTIIPVKHISCVQLGCTVSPHIYPPIVSWFPGPPTPSSRCCTLAEEKHVVLLWIALNS